MAALVRRFLVVCALLFWQGGFTFYAAVVVPVGSAVLGSHTEQGFVTRRVTDFLNLAGAAALPLLAWDAAASRRGAALWRRLRWSAWVALALTLGLLAWMHVRLDALLAPDAFEVLDRAAFRAGTAPTCGPARRSGSAPWATSCSPCAPGARKTGRPPRGRPRPQSRKWAAEEPHGSPFHGPAIAPSPRGGTA